MNELISLEEAKKDIFNLRELKEKNVSQFLLYFAQILQLALETGLIDKETQLTIGNCITNAIEIEVVDEEDEDFNDPGIPISNYMYVITLYLKSMSNWEAWLEIKDISSISDAEKFLKKSKEWLLANLQDLSQDLQIIEKDVYKIKVKHIIEMCGILKNKVKHFGTFDFINTCLDLKSLHLSDTDYLYQYFFLQDYQINNSDNYLERLRKMIEAFGIEVRIMEKIDVKKLFGFKQVEKQRRENALSEKGEELEKDMKAKLAQIQKRHEQERQEAIKAKIDFVEITEKHSQELLEFNENWAREEDRQNDDFFKDLQDQGELQFEKYSLIDVIREYAVFSLATKGKIKYPKTMEQRGKFLSELDTKEAVKEFLESEVVETLSKSEIGYLEEYMDSQE